METLNLTYNLYSVFYISALGVCACCVFVCLLACAAQSLFFIFRSFLFLSCVFFAFTYKINTFVMRFLFFACVKLVAWIDDALDHEYEIHPTENYRIMAIEWFCFTFYFSSRLLFLQIFNSAIMFYDHWIGDLFCAK